MPSSLGSELPNRIQTKLPRHKQQDINKWDLLGLLNGISRFPPR